jgi:hypothetical protein
LATPAELNRFTVSAAPPALATGLAGLNPALNVDAVPARNHTGVARPKVVSNVDINLRLFFRPELRYSDAIIRPPFFPDFCFSKKIYFVRVVPFRGSLQIPAPSLSNKLE